MVKVIGAGFGRTGTASLKGALEYLGFGPCYHMFEIIARPELGEPWSRAVDGESVDWKNVFEGFQSTVDFPGCLFYQQLMDTFPDAKVILTVRDPERWYDSVYNTIYQYAKDVPDDPRYRAGEAFNAFMPTIKKMIWRNVFDDRFEERDYAIQKFHEHTAEVQRTVPADRLLTYRVGEGWEPLCEFLGVEVPDEEFPHINESANMSDLVDKVQAEGEVPSPMPERE